MKTVQEALEDRTLDHALVGVKHVRESVMSILKRAMENAPTDEGEWFTIGGHLDATAQEVGYCMHYLDEIDAALRTLGEKAYAPVPAKSTAQAARKAG